jgi:hypothetical protein
MERKGREPGNGSVEMVSRETLRVVALEWGSRRYSNEAYVNE